MIFYRSSAAAQGFYLFENQAYQKALRRCTVAVIGK